MLRVTTLRANIIVFFNSNPLLKYKRYQKNTVPLPGSQK